MILSMHINWKANQIEFRIFIIFSKDELKYVGFTNALRAEYENMMEFKRVNTI